jgi:hypothetical protein
MDNASNNDTTLVYIAKHLKEIGITNLDSLLVEYDALAIY